MKQMKRGIGTTALVVAFLAISGCVHSYHVGMGEKTPTALGQIKLYSTDNVPFEYQELSYVSCHVDGGVAELFRPRPQDEVLSSFRDQVVKAGGDAVINFRMYASFHGGYLIFPGSYFTIVSGTAVKIRRP